MCMSGFGSGELLQMHFDEVHSVQLDSGGASPPSHQQTSASPIPITLPNESSKGDAKVDIITTQKNQASNVEPLHAIDKMKQDGGDAQNTSGDHGNAGSKTHPDVGNMPMNKTEMDMDYTELETTLQEEKWYSNELKQELEKKENELLSQKQELSIVQQQMGIAIKTNEELAREKEKVMEKLITKSEECAEMQSIIDEFKSDKLQYLTNAENQSTELAKAAAWIRDLESQLIERPGADDVLVLKKELVSVQQLMDQLTQDSETQLEETKSNCKNLEEEKNSLLQEIERLKEKHKNDLSSQMTSQAILAESLQHKESINSKAEENAKEERDKLKEEISNAETTLQNEQAHSRALELKNVEVEGKYEFEKQQKEKIQAEMYALKSDNVKSKKDCDVLTLELSAKDEELAKARKRISDLMHQSEASSSNTDMALREKSSHIEALSQQYNDAVNEINKIKVELEETVKSKNANLESLNTAQDVQRQLELDKSLEIQRLEQAIESMNTKLTQASSSDSKMQEKIEVLEADAKKAWEDLHEEKSKIKLLSLEHENQMSILKGDKEKLEKELQHQQNCVQDADKRISSFEKQIMEKNEIVKTLEDDIASLQQKGDGLEKNLQEVKKRADSVIREKSDILADVKRLQQERTDFMEKMEVGEGQAVLIAQLKEENESLTRKLEQNDLKAKDNIWQLSESIKAFESDIAGKNTELKQLEDNLALEKSRATSLEKSVETERNANSILKEQLKDGEDERTKLRASLSNQKLEMESSNSTLERTLNEKSREYDKLLSTYDGFKSSSESSMKMIEATRVGLQENLNSSREENTRLEVEKRGLEEKMKSKEDQLESLKTSMVNLKSQHQNEMATLKDRYQTKKANLNLQVQATQEQVSKIKTELDAARNNIAKMEEMLSGKTKSIKMLEIDLADNENVIANLKTEIEDGKVKAAQLTNDMQVAKQAHVTELDQLTGSHKELVNKLTQEKTKACEDLQNAINDTNSNSEKLISELKMQITNQSEEMKSKISEIGILKASLDEKSDDLAKMKTQHSTEKNDLNKEVQILSNNLVDAGAEHKKLSSLQQKTASELSAMLSELAATKSKVSELEKKNFLSDEEVKDLSARLDKALKSLDSMTQEKATETENVKSAQRLIHESQEEKAQLETSLTELKHLHDSTAQEKTLLEDKLTSLEAELKETESTLCMKEEELDTMKQYFDAKMKEMSSEKETLESKIEECSIQVAEEKAKLEEETFLRNRDKDTWKTEKDEMIESHKVKTLKWSTEKDELVQSQETLKGAQEILISTKVKIQNQLEASLEELSQEKDKFHKYQESHDAKLAEELMRRQRLQVELDQEKEKLKVSDNEKESIKERLQLELSTLRDNLDSVRGEWQQALQQVEERNTESDELRGQVVVLQATVQNNADERRALLERCLTAEQSVEQYKQNEAQLKRRLDNAQAAMHELGRENQAMQVTGVNRFIISMRNFCVNKMWVSSDTEVVGY